MNGKMTKKAREYQKWGKGAGERGQRALRSNIKMGGWIAKLLKKKKKQGP